MSNYSHEQQMCLPEPEANVCEAPPPVCSVPEQNTVGNSERAARIDQSKNRSGSQMQLESSVEHRNGTAAGVTAGTEGVEVQISRELIRPDVELRIPLSGVATATDAAGIWLSVRPSLQFSGRASYGSNANAPGNVARVQGRVQGGIQTLIRGGVQRGGTLLANVFGGGNASVNINAAGELANNQLSIHTFNGEGIVEALMGLELRVSIPRRSEDDDNDTDTEDDYSIGRRFTWSPGGPQQLIAFTGPTWRQGQGFSGGFDVRRGTAIRNLERWYSANIQNIERRWQRARQAFGDAGSDPYSGAGWGDWCWVAREVIPDEWEDARRYIVNHSPSSFQSLYGAYGKKLATRVSMDPYLREKLTPAFRQFAQEGRKLNPEHNKQMLLLVADELVSV